MDEVTQNIETTITYPPLDQENYGKKKKWMAFGGVIVLLFIVSLFLPNQMTPSKSKPQQNTNQLIALIGDHPVYASEVKAVASEQYLPSAINQTALNSAFNTLAERYILDKEAIKLGLVVSNQEIIDYLKSEGYDTTQTIPKSIKESTKYAILTNKISVRILESREAYSFGFYTASYADEQQAGYTSDEKALIERQRAQSPQALSEVVQKLQTGEAPLVIAHEIYDKYPDLQPLFSLNGYVLQSVTDVSFLKQPKIYDELEKNINQPFFQDIFSMKVNQIKQVNVSDGSGGYVIQLKKINPGIAQSYDDWLKTQKKLIKTY